VSLSDFAAPAEPGEDFGHVTIHQGDPEDGVAVAGSKQCLSGLAEAHDAGMKLIVGSRGSVAPFRAD
jgi:hypothetical protein